MSADNDDAGPVVEFRWTFPLFRVVSKQTKNLKSKIGNVGQEEESMPEPLQEAVGDGEEETDGQLTDLRDRLDSVSDPDTTATSGGLSFAEESVNFSGDVFVPTEVEAETGEQVEFKNDTESSVEIEFDDGSGITVEGNGTGAKQFQEPGAYDFSVSGINIEDTCGAVVVGDTDEEPVLPCRADVDRDIFEDEEGNGNEVTTDFSSSTESPKSLGEAADEKQNKDRGF
jgi:plastocyanin